MVLKSISKRLLFTSLVVAAPLAVLSFAGFSYDWKHALPPHAAANANPPSAGQAGPYLELVDERADTVRLTSKNAMQVVGVRLAEVRLAPRPEPLRLPGSLALDPNRLIHVHSRFAGELIRIGDIDEAGSPRPLRYGDKVRQGQILAVIWSREIGEKKSELVDAISRLDASRTLLSRLESLPKGIVAERSVLEARRNVEADLIAAAKAERTLRSWRLADAEIDAVRQEVKLIQKRTGAGDVAGERKWAEMEIRAAIDGVVIEKNFNVGDIVEPDDDLFKIADLSRLQVVVNAYEEDLWAIRALSREQRRWKIDLSSDPTDNAIDSTFDLIGSAIDPAQRTGLVMGWLDNADGKLAVGQFVTATIELPADPGLVALPESALIEEGDLSMVFVETNAQRREFTRYKIQVARRCAGTVFVKTTANGAVQPGNGELVAAGAKVVVSGVLGLGGELANLKAVAASKASAQPKDASGQIARPSVNGMVNASLQRPAPQPAAEPQPL